jgi:hypothetical protein
MLPMEKPRGTLVTTAREELSTLAVRVLQVGSREEGFSLYRRFLAEARPRSGPEQDHVNSPQEPKDALGRNYCDLVLFADETEARPSLVGASSPQAELL